MEMKKLLESLQECGMDMPPAPMDRGNPVTMNVSLSATGTEHVEDLISMMKNAGLDSAKQVGPDMMPQMPMRMDMEKFRDIVDGPEMEEAEEEGPCEECGMDPCECDHTEEAYANEPDEDYKDDDYMIHDLSGGINRKKKQYAKAQDGDNAMAMEDAIRKELYKLLSEKKAKPDFLDMDKDGDKKEPMKKAIKDKGSKPKKGEVPPQFKK